MEKIIISLILLLGIFFADFTSALSKEEMEKIAYGSSSLDRYREITYWASARLYIDNYEYSSDDVEYLKLVTVKKRMTKEPIDELQKHFISEFRRLFSKLPFHDMHKGLEKRFIGYKDYEEFSAREEARTTSVYGGKPGTISCHVHVKRKRFPILYEIKCIIGTRSNLSYDRSGNEIKHLDYSTPEHVVNAIKLNISNVLTEQKNILDKIRKYGNWIQPTLSVNTITIRRAQSVLEKDGFHHGTVDGIMGPLTEDAIRQYQANQNLSVTGKLDTPTLRAMGIKLSR